VMPRGVLLVQRLLTDGDGPLYSGRRAGSLRGMLQEALAALEPDGAS
jgi:hypothetical protein